MDLPHEWRLYFNSSRYHITVWVSISVGIKNGDPVSLYVNKWANIILFAEQILILILKSNWRLKVEDFGVNNENRKKSIIVLLILMWISWPISFKYRAVKASCYSYSLLPAPRHSIRTAIRMNSRIRPQTACIHFSKKYST